VGGDIGQRKGLRLFWSVPSVLADCFERFLAGVPRPVVTCLMPYRWASLRGVLRHYGERSLGSKQSPLSTEASTTLRDACAGVRFWFTYYVSHFFGSSVSRGYALGGCVALCGVSAL
jgi:hypothetical protein